MGDKLMGKVAAVTGGTAGIGLGIASAFVGEGASVALMARNPEKGAKALSVLDVGERAIFIPGDAMVQADVEGFLDQTRRRQTFVFQHNSLAGRCLPEFVETRVRRTHLVIKMP